MNAHKSVCVFQCTVYVTYQGELKLTENPQRPEKPETAIIRYLGT
jgi:hypothetical protein